MNNQNTSDLLHAFLDGELEQAHEQPLFQELASSGELRNEMRELLAMRSAVQQDIEAFTPPPMATSNIFSTLGFTLPAAGTATLGETIPSAIGASSTAATSWWSKMWLPSAAAFIGAGITFWLLNWGYDSNLNAMASAHAQEIQKIRNEANAQLSAQANSFRNQQQNDEPKVIIRTEKVYVPKVEYRYLDNAEQSNNAQLHIPNTTSNDNPKEESASLATVNERQPLFAQYYSSGTSNMFHKQSSSYFASPIAQDNTLVDSHDALTGEIIESKFLPKDEPYYQSWSVKLGGVASTFASTPTPTLDAPSATFNDLNVQLMYSVREDLSFGVKFGREAFPLHYNGVISGHNITRDQYSSVYWGGLSAQYQPEGLSFFGGMQPYISLFGGASEIGTLFRSELGLQYPLSSRFSISAGYDISGLFYQFQDKGFTTVKTGLNSGIIIHF